MLLQSYLASPRARRALSTRPGEAGFSLIELVVVIAILGILIAIALPNFLNVQKDAKINQAKTALAGIIKECAVAEARNKVPVFFEIQTDEGNLGDYRIVSPNGVTPVVNNAGGAWTGANEARDNSNGAVSATRSCYSVAAVPGAVSSLPVDWVLPGFAISYSGGVTSKFCRNGTAQGHYSEVGNCNEANNVSGTAW